MKMKILEKIQLTPDATTTDIVDFCHMSSQLKNFVASGDSPIKADNFHVSHYKNKRPEVRHSQLDQTKKCSNCGSIHAPRKCPAYGKTCKETQKTQSFCPRMSPKNNRL